MQTNVRYYGDNLDILRRYLPDASVDLIYLDPPFNSNRDDNVIFRDESGAGSARHARNVGPANHGALAPEPPGTARQPRQVSRYSRAVQPIRRATAAGAP